MTSTTICAEYSTQTAEQQPVGPCVLRPGHRGHIHQDMRGIQWATRPDSSGCCVCGGGPIVYHNYLGNPVCAHCSNCECGERPCAVDGQGPLEDEGLQGRLDAALRVMHRSEQETTDLRRRLAEAEKDRDTAQEGRRLYAAACAEAIRRQRSAEVSVARVRALAGRWQAQGQPYSLYAHDVLNALDNAA